MAVQELVRVVIGEAQHALMCAHELHVAVRESNVGVLLQCLAQRGERTGREFVVRVEDDHEGGVGEGEPGVPRTADTGILLAYDPDALRELVQRKPCCVIGRAIVDDDDGRRAPGLVECTRQAAPQVVPVVEARDDHGDGRVLGHRVPTLCADGADPSCHTSIA